jgi:hypothetical protein
VGWRRMEGRQIMTSTIRAKDEPSAARARPRAHAWQLWKKIEVEKQKRSVLRFSAADSKFYRLLRMAVRVACTLVRAPNRTQPVIVILEDFKSMCV